MNGRASNIILYVQSTFRVGPEMAAHPIQDLEFWYNSGPGQPTSAAQGIGYVQEPVSRLTLMPLTALSTMQYCHFIKYVMFQRFVTSRSRAVITALNFTKPGSEWTSTD